MNLHISLLRITKINAVKPYYWSDEPDLAYSAYSANAYRQQCQDRVWQSICRFKERARRTMGLLEAAPDNEMRRKYIGVGGNDVPSLGVLEGDILRILWDTGVPQSSVQVYESMHFARRREKREMQSPSTIAVTLSRMVEKRLLTVERRPRGGKGYYCPTRSRAGVVADVMDDVSRRLTGQPLGYLLSRLMCLQTEKPFANVSLNSDEKSPDNDQGLKILIDALRKLQMEDNKPLPVIVETY